MPHERNNQMNGINQSSTMRNLNIPGNIENNNPSQNNNPGQNNDINGDEDLPGFCINGICNLGFSSLDDEGDISLDNNYEMLDSDSETKSCNIDLNNTGNNMSIKKWKNNH